MQYAVQRVTDEGGVIAGFSSDEPLTNARDCHQSMEATADGHAAWTHAIRALGPMHVGWLEGWPDYTTFDSISKFMRLLKDRDAVPDYFHPDVFWDHATNSEATKFLHQCQELCAQYGVTFGVFINSTKDPIATDAQHHQNLLALAQKVHTILPDATHVCVAAWAHRIKDDPTHKTQNVPNNLGANGLLETFAAVRTIFKDVAPVPLPEGDEMLYVKLIEDRDPLAVKEIKDVGNGESVLVLPDFVDSAKPNETQHNAVFSMQPVGPTGTDGYRAEGTVGAYEKCRVTGNTATFRPVPQLPLARIFMLVGGA
jgi:hypothetical protein